MPTVEKVIHALKRVAGEGLGTVISEEEVDYRKRIMRLYELRQMGGSKGVVALYSNPGADEKMLVITAAGFDLVYAGLTVRAYDGYSRVMDATGRAKRNLPALKREYGLGFRERSVGCKDGVRIVDERYADGTGAFGLNLMWSDMPAKIEKPKSAKAL
jgi:hypothetical protein